MFINRLALVAEPGGALRSFPNTHFSRIAARIGRLATCVTCLVTIAHGSYESTVKLAWNQNPEPNIARYELSYGTASGQYQQTVNAGLETRATVNGLEEGSLYYFAVAAISETGLRSPFSAEVIHFSGFRDALGTHSWTALTAGGEQAFDGDAATFFLAGSGMPDGHDLVIDLGGQQAVGGLRYLPRQDGSNVGNITQYEISVSADGLDWGSPVAEGTFSGTTGIKEVRFTAQYAGFVRLRGLADASGSGACAVAELEIIEAVVPIPESRPPTALPLALVTSKNIALPISLSCVDPDGSPLNYTILSEPLHGTLGGTAPDLLYTPDANFTGDDQFVFQASNGKSASLRPQAFTLTGTDPDGDPLTFTLRTLPTGGVITGTPPNLTYTSRPGFIGLDMLGFVVSDGINTTEETLVAFTVIRDLPRLVVEAQTVSTSKRQPIAIRLSGTHSDGDSLSYSISSQPVHGTLTGTPPDLIYTPTGNFAGSDEFTWTNSPFTLRPAAPNPLRLRFPSWWKTPTLRRSRSPRQWKLPVTWHCRSPWLPPISMATHSPSR